MKLSSRTLIYMLRNKQYSVLWEFYITSVQCYSMVQLLCWTYIFIFAFITSHNIYHIFFMYMLNSVWLQILREYVWIWKIYLQSKYHKLYTFFLVHFVTPSRDVLSFVSNLALVSICFKFLGCLLLLIILFSLIVLSNFSHSLSWFKFWYASVNNSGFFLLNVVTEGMISSFCFTFFLRSSIKGMLLRRYIPLFINVIGEERCFKAWLSSVRRRSRSCRSLIIVQIRLARLYGIDLSRL